jgi:hypothetical protein
MRNSLARIEQHQPTNDGEKGQEELAGDRNDESGHEERGDEGSEERTWELHYAETKDA